MKTKTVYRFEYKGRGIYKAALENTHIDVLLNKHDLRFNSAKNPTPYSDRSFKEEHLKFVGDSDFIFGFTTKGMIHRWFTREAITDFSHAGVELRILQVEENSVFSSRKQTIFSKNSIDSESVLTGSDILAFIYES